MSKKIIELPSGVPSDSSLGFIGDPVTGQLFQATYLVLKNYFASTGFVTTSSFNAFLASYAADSASLLNIINNVYLSESKYVLTSSFNSYSASQATISSSINATIGNVYASESNYTTTASFLSFTAGYFVDSASFLSKINNVFLSESKYTLTSSFNSFSSSYAIDSASFLNVINNVFQSESKYTLTSSFNTLSSSYSGDSGSFDARIKAISSSTPAGVVLTSSFNPYTASINVQLTNIVLSQSNYVLTTTYSTFSSSVYSDSSSFDSRIRAISGSNPIGFVTTTSFFAFTQSYQNYTQSVSGTILNVYLSESNYTTTASFLNFTAGYFVDSASFNSRIATGSISASNIYASQSGYLTTASFTAASNSINVSILNVYASESNYVPTASFNPWSASINTFTGSVNTQLVNIFASQSNYTLTSSFNTFSSSYVVNSSSFLTLINNTFLSESQYLPKSFISGVPGVIPQFSSSFGLITSSMSQSAAGNILVNKSTDDGNNFQVSGGATIGNIGLYQNFNNTPTLTMMITGSLINPSTLIGGAGNLTGFGGIVAAVAIGWQALQVRQSGSGMVAIGVQTLNSYIGQVSELGHTAVGYRALNQLVSGSQNTAVGYRSFLQIASGSKNTAIGAQALLGGIAGPYNVQNTVAIGVDTLLSVTASLFNIAIGVEALRNSTNVYNTIAIGYQSAISGSYSSSILIGNIGTGKSSSTGFLTNTIIIANNLVTDTDNLVLIGNSSQSMIIGARNDTVSQGQKLQVLGSTYLSGALYDSLNNIGSSGYVLTATATGVQWQNVSTSSFASSSINALSASFAGNYTTTSSFQAFTASYFVDSASVYTLIRAISQSVPVGFVTTSSFQAYTASTAITIANIFASESNYTLTSSFNTYSSSTATTINNVFASESRYLLTSSFVNIGTISGSGNPRFLPYYSSSTALTSSIVYQSGSGTGSVIFVNPPTIPTSSFNAKLQVFGDIYVSGAYVDAVGNTGTAAQVLTSTGTGQAIWANAAGGGSGGSGSAVFTLEFIVGFSPGAPTVGATSSVFTALINRRILGFEQEGIPIPFITGSGPRTAATFTSGSGTLRIISGSFETGSYYWILYT